MTANVPDGVARAFEAHDAVLTTSTGYEITSTVFDSVVTAREGPEGKHTYTVTVFVPTIDAATVDAVGEAVSDGWLETFERRLADAPKATRSQVELRDFDVETMDDEELQVTYSFTWTDEKRATEIAKTFVEYVEGTYVEGLVPGYEYVPPVSELLANASQSGTDGTPL